MKSFIALSLFILVLQATSVVGLNSSPTEVLLQSLRDMFQQFMSSNEKFASSFLGKLESMVFQIVYY